MARPAARDRGLYALRAPGGVLVLDCGASRPIRVTIPRAAIGGLMAGFLSSEFGDRKAVGKAATHEADRTQQKMREQIEDIERSR